MTSSELVKQLFLSFNKKDNEAFINTAKEYINREKRKKHNVVAKELEKALFQIGNGGNSISEKRFKNNIPIPRDSDKGFPLLEIKQYNDNWEKLVLSPEIKNQLEQIVKEFRDSDILSTYNLTYKRKILLCGKPGTGKTFSVQVFSSLLNLPVVYVRFDSIISSFLGETAANLRKVFDYIEHGTWTVLFDEFDIIGKNRNDNHEHGEIKRVVNNFLQMVDNFKGDSIVFAATNHQNMLDPAIWRRFDDVIYYELPGFENRKILFEQYLKPINKSQDIDIAMAAKKSENLSPADIKMIAEEAIKSTIINSKKVLDAQTLIISIEKFIKRERVKQNLLGVE